MKVPANVKPLADNVSVLLASLSAFADKTGSIVAWLAGVSAFVWTCIRIYEYIKSKRVPPVNKE